MTSFISRPLLDASDLQAMTALLLRARAADHIDKWPSVAELRVISQTSNEPWDLRLWTGATNSLLAFALLDTTYGSLYFIVDPDHESSELDLQIIAWAQQRIPTLSASAPALRCVLRDDDTRRIALVEHLGFERQDRWTLRMARSLAEPIGRPRLPEGFTIRPVRGEQEVEQYVAMHREAFGTTNMTVEHRLAVMRDPAYIPDLDLVAVAPDGTLAALCLGAIDRAENEASGRREGWTDPIGTRPAFRRQGLATAVILEGLARLRAGNMDTALLGTGSWNTAAQSVFRSAGFRELYRMVRYCKSEAG
jgi:mycothiol synthase